MVCLCILFSTLRVISVIMVVGGAGAKIDWGILASCAGCSQVWADVQEVDAVEILVVDCACPPGQDDCLCSARFDWWWNMKCAANVSVRSTSPGVGCVGSVVDWKIVAGNVSSENRVESDSGVCPTTHQLCTSRLENLSVSSRRVDVQVRLTSTGCTSPQRVTWSLPIEASLTCTNVEQLIGGCCAHVPPTIAFPRRHTNKPIEPHPKHRSKQLHSCIRNAPLPLISFRHL